MSAQQLIKSKMTTAEAIQNLINYGFTKEDAILATEGISVVCDKYLAKNQASECECGDTLGVSIYDDNGEWVEWITICDQCL